MSGMALGAREEGGESPQMEQNGLQMEGIRLERAGSLHLRHGSVSGSRKFHKVPRDLTIWYHLGILWGRV